MLKKRLIGVVTIRDGWAVQSFGYGRYLPLGKPECLVENLDRWGADEILIQVIDRSIRNLGPAFEVVAKIAERNVATPITYVGGLRSHDDAVAIVRAGADRVAVDALLHSNPNEVRKMADRLGAQAILATFPSFVDDGGKPRFYDYLNRRSREMSADVRALIDEGVISEAILVDKVNEGRPGGFDFRILETFADSKIALVLFGGLSEPAQLERALLDPRVSAVAVGNFLSYREHAVQSLKSRLGVTLIRPPFYHQQTLS